ncbi:MAG: pyruvate kinase [Acidobacteriota bacterium]|nr:pyruvate kinase [Acidobacteriota bacterium]
MSDSRRTKIVATVGPASQSPEVIAAMADAGMDVARVPLAHGTVEEAVARVRAIRAAAPGVGIMPDLPGPKIRTAAFPPGGVALPAGSVIALRPARDGDTSTSEAIGVCHPDLVGGLEAGDRVALGDGGVVLTVQRRTGDSVEALVHNGGRLQGRPGVTAPSGRVELDTPTADDLRRLEVLIGEGVDAVAVSFVRSAADMDAVRRAAGADCPLLVAKIETPEAVGALEQIVASADAVMVARGDLGVRMALEDVPHIQKEIIRVGVRYARPVITATQMLESMITAPVPTRAEVADVANAVLDGTSAVMLSGETAVGADPVSVIETMARITRRAEQDFDSVGWATHLAPQQVPGGPVSVARLTAATTAAGWRAAMEQNASCIVACTRSGTTARSISRFRPPMPLIACTPSERTARALTLSWGVRTLTIGEASSTDEIVWFAVQAVVGAGYASPGDVIVVLAGSPIEPEPATDTMRLVRIH